MSFASGLKIRLYVIVYKSQQKHHSQKQVLEIYKINISYVLHICMYIYIYIIGMSFNLIYFKVDMFLALLCRLKFIYS